MNLTEMKARLEVITASLSELKNSAVEGLSAEQMKEAQELTNEYGTLKNSIQTVEALEATVTSIDNTVSTKKTAPIAVATVSNLTVGQDRRMLNGNGGYDTTGDFFKAIKGQVVTGGELDTRLKAAQQERVGEDGGFLVPSDLIGEIQTVLDSDESLLSRCRKFNVKGNRLSMMVNEKAPWDGSSDSIQTYWTGEGKKIVESQTTVADVDIKLEKLASLVNVTEEMLEDSAAIESLIRSEVPKSMNAKINNAIISGNGVKKPLGILNSAFGHEVAKESGQTAATVVFKNVRGLYSHALPSAKKNGIFLMNMAVEEQLIGMQLDEASADSPSIYLPNQSIAGAPYGTLFGKPVYPMLGAMPALGAKGDLIFVDFSYYYAALKTQGLKSQVSVHAKWDTDEQSFKFTYRIGGKCPFSKEQSTEYGNYKVSGYTYLQARA